jgi:hypothetical protein
VGAPSHLILPSINCDLPEKEGIWTLAAGYKSLLAS